MLHEVCTCTYVCKYRHRYWRTSLTMVVVLTYRVYHLLHTGLEQMKDRCGQIAAINFIRSSPYITGTILWLHCIIEIFGGQNREKILIRLIFYLYTSRYTNDKNVLISASYQSWFWWIINLFKINQKNIITSSL